MKFGLSTMFFVAALVAVLFGWHHDRQSRLDFSGKWVFPAQDESQSFIASYLSDTLIIKPDGRFQKTQKLSIAVTTYSGTWETDEAGFTTFHVTEVANLMFSGSTESVDADYRFLCRCSVDPFGYLIVNEYVENRELYEFDEKTKDVHWRSYRRH